MPKESIIQQRVKRKLIGLGWHVEVLSCNAYQKGIPDLYAFKTVRRPDWKPEVCRSDCEVHRWIDIKRPKGSTLTKAQCQKWPLWESIGLGVWVLTGEEPDLEAVLLGPPNFRDWWKPRYDKYLIRPSWQILEES